MTGAQAVYFYPEGQPWQQNQVPPQGGKVECPPVTTVYNLRVVKLDNSVEVRQITVFVEQVPGAPVIERFTVDPPSQIMAGQCVDVTWAVTGNVSTVKLTRNTVDLWPGGAPVSGTLQDCPPGSGQIAYTLEATGPGGTSRLQRTVNVVSHRQPIRHRRQKPRIPRLLLRRPQLLFRRLSTPSWSIQHKSMLDSV